MSSLEHAVKELLLREAKYLFEGCTKEENPEYLRGMSELIASLHRRKDVETEQVVFEMSSLITQNLCPTCPSSSLTVPLSIGSAKMP